MATHDVRVDLNATPRLDSGLTLLMQPSARSTAIHAVVLNELLERDGGDAFWIDTHDLASSYALYDLSPSTRLLDGLRIGRAFTPFQHHSLVSAVVRDATPRTEFVVPNVGSLYASTDVPGWEGKELLERSLLTLRELAQALDIPVLVTAAPGASSPILDQYTDREFTCRQTENGYAFEGEDFRTLVYWDDGWFQTTIPYWVELYGAVTDDEPAFATTDYGLADMGGVTDGPDESHLPDVRRTDEARLATV